MEYALGTEGTYSLDIYVANVSSEEKIIQNITTAAVFVEFLKGFLTVFF